MYQDSEIKYWIKIYQLVQKVISKVIKEAIQELNHKIVKIKRVIQFQNKKLKWNLMNFSLYGYINLI